MDNIFDEKLSQEAKNVLPNLSNQERIIEYKKLSFKRDKNLNFDFRDYRSLKELFKAIYYRNLSIDKAERIQDEYEAQFAALEKYKRKNSYYVTARKNLLINAKKFYDGSGMIINAIKDKIFPLNSEDVFENEDEDEDRFYSEELAPIPEFSDFEEETLEHMPN